MRTEDCLKRWSPCQDSIDQPTTAVQNLNRDQNHVLPKRVKVHAQKFAFLLATLFPSRRVAHFFNRKTQPALQIPGQNRHHHAAHRCIQIPASLLRSLGPLWIRHRKLESPWLLHDQTDTHLRRTGQLWQRLPPQYLPGHTPRLGCSVHQDCCHQQSKIKS